jgi:hypothetical protein
MPNKTRKILGVGFFLVTLFLMLQNPSALLAQDQPPDQPQGPAQDPPGRVARLNYSIGSVSFQPGGTGDWVQAVPNRPLTTGDNLWADKDSRAELHTGSTAIRMDSETSLTFLNLDDRTTQLRLSQGSLIVRVRHLDDEDNFEVDTPNSAFTIQRTGEYRIDVNADGNETDVTVWHGRGEAVGGGESYVVVAGQRAKFTGTDQLNHDIEQIPNRDDFDEWAFNRDQHEDKAESANYISTEMTGYEDLDDYGRWNYVAGYGPVWAPVGIAPGWAPYRFGHWVWVAPWGWTWVEDEPWGFAPFHYGRWAFVNAGWCWVPGPVVVRPVYAPAFVAFVGGGGFSFGVGIGAGVAWFPLAPREVFVPWYRTSPTYVNNVNITNTRVNITQVTNVYNTYNSTTINTTNVNRITYVNQHVTNAVTAVNHDTFVNARPVASNLAKVDARQMAEAPVMRNAPAEPARASVVGAGRPVSIHPPAVALNRPVVATRTPPPLRTAFGAPERTNVRTENPSEARPVETPRTETPERSPETARPSEPSNPRPVENIMPRAETENNPSRPAAENNAPREGVENNSPRPGSAPEARPVPRPPAAEGGHPLVRPAPPVQERPEVQKSEEQKFQTWQAQRPKPEAARPLQRAPEPPREAPRPPHK